MSESSQNTTRWAFSFSTRGKPAVGKKNKNKKLGNGEKKKTQSWALQLHLKDQNTARISVLLMLKNTPKNTNPSVFGSHAYQPPQRSVLGGDDGGGTGRVVHERQLPEAALIVILTHACSWYHNVKHSPAGRGQRQAVGEGVSRENKHTGKLQQDQTSKWG